MRRPTRQHMVAGASELLAERGLQGTSFSGVIERTGAPRGSIYHHFPGGKEEMIRDAIAEVGRGVAALIDALEADTPEEVIDAFVSGWRFVLEGSGYRRGCAVAAVTISAGTDATELLPASAEVFESWHASLTSALVRAGASGSTATEVSTVALVAVEGALIVGRATHDPSLFDILGRQLRRLLG